LENRLIFDENVEKLWLTVLESADINVLVLIEDQHSCSTYLDRWPSVGL